MNIKRNLCIVTLLLLVLISGCEAVQQGEITSPGELEAQEEANLPDVAQDEIDDKEAPLLLADIEPPPGSQTPITRENVLLI